MMSSKPLVLCVDDESNVVESISLNLRRNYRVLTALSGAAGLETLREHTDVAVVISDMRMAGMDGAQFLAEVKVVAPTAVRMLLTGYSDIEAAMRAVNDGQIFRFLTKPCAPDHLLATVAAGVEQNRLINAERILLQKTLLGSVKAIIEIMALGNPMALGRAVRIRDTVRKAAARLDVVPWQVEFAALISQLGAVSLPDDSLRRLYDGETLNESELRKLSESSATISRILRKIPRLEVVTGLLEELAVLNMASEPRTASPGAGLLKAAIDLDALAARGTPLSDALKALRGSESLYGVHVLDALEVLKSDPEQLTVVTVPIGDLKDGMVICDDLKTSSGVLILPRGMVLNESSREHVENFVNDLPREVKVFVTSDTDDRPNRRSA